jgi:hypothetical protein
MKVVSSQIDIIANDCDQLRESTSTLAPLTWPFNEVDKSCAHTMDMRTQCVTIFDKLTLANQQRRALSDESVNVKRDIDQHRDVVDKIATFEDLSPATLKANDETIKV